jgi:hypothetical protein
MFEKMEAPMDNFIHRINYALINLLHIKIKPPCRPHYIPLLTESFENLSRWTTTQQDTVAANNVFGAVLSVQTVNGKGYIAPAIISNDAFFYGIASAALLPNLHHKMVNTVAVRSHDNEWGFKLTENKLTIVSPEQSTLMRLRHPLKRHAFSVEFNRAAHTVYWRVDHVVVHEMPCPKTPHNKHLMVSLSSTDKKLLSKELPQNLTVLHAEINAHK